MNNPGGYCLIDFRNPTTDGKTIRGIYQKIGAAYNSGKMLIISNFAPTPLALWVTKVETEEVEIEGENVTFDKYTIGVYNTKENDKNYENVVTVRYNDEVKLSKTEITGGSGLPEIDDSVYVDYVLTVKQNPETGEQYAAWERPLHEIPSVGFKPAGTALVATDSGDWGWGPTSVNEVRLLDDNGEEFIFPYIYIGDLFEEDFTSAECGSLLDLAGRYASGYNGRCEYNGILPQITVSEGGYPDNPSSVRAVQLLTYQAIDVPDVGYLKYEATFLYYNEYIHKHLLIKASVLRNDSPQPTSEITIIHTFDY